MLRTTEDKKIRTEEYNGMETRTYTTTRKKLKTDRKMRYWTI